MSRLPLIGVTLCPGQIGLHTYHISGDTHVHAAASAAKGVQVIVRSLPDVSALSDILDGLHGILFSGALSNIEPFHAGGSANVSGPAHDSARPFTRSLIHDIVEVGLCARSLQWQSVPSDADASNNA
ncbi:putative glutamine amidotransferase [Pseudomonas lini]|nr:putative glutamine amidotransferase [Pseudomonas lini]